MLIMVTGCYDYVMLFIYYLPQHVLVEHVCCCSCSSFVLFFKCIHLRVLYKNMVESCTCSHMVRGRYDDMMLFICYLPQHVLVEYVCRLVFQMCSFESLVTCIWLSLVHVHIWKGVL